MHILMITDNDPAGMGIAFTKAINRYTEHNCRLITRATRYNFNFDTDLHLPKLDESGYEEIFGLLARADIIHFHILCDESVELGPIKVKDFIAGKALLHHHHGHPHFRSNPQKYRDKYRRLKRRVLVSTPDLLRLLPEAVWQPNLVPINDPLYAPKAPASNGSIIIGQSATRRDLKNTDDLIAVASEIRSEMSFPTVKVDIIENTDHKECLSRKNNCHIIFDHMQGYYGVSSLESLSQGKPVIAGLDEWNRLHINRWTGTPELPWVIARNKSDLKEKLMDLCTDEDNREEIGKNGRSFMERYWTDRLVVNKLSEFYKTL